MQRRYALIQVVVLLLSFCPLVSCNPEAARQPPAGESWNGIVLPEGWNIKVPDSIVFSVSKGDPTGSKGSIHTTNGKLDFKVYCNHPKYAVDHPSLANSITEARYAIDSGIWHNNFNIPVEHTGSIDTVNGFVFTIIEPVVVGKGTVSVMIEDYLTSAWIELRGTNITYEQQTILLEISRTIRRKKI